MIRKYGSEPYSIAVVHGGPGALGSVAGLARVLSSQYGVLEPIQSKYSISELIEELKEQLTDHCSIPVTLIGHSWGAWLVALFTEQYPMMVKKVIMIGSGPLEVKYVSEIMERRKRNMTVEQKQEFDDIILLLEQDNQPDKGQIHKDQTHKDQTNKDQTNKDHTNKELLDKDQTLARLGELVGKSDDYHAIDIKTEKEDALSPDGEAYAKIWPEAAKLRESGRLLEVFKNIKIPMVFIQGDSDPHPYEGVVMPLLENNINFEGIYKIEKCGHTPWKEKYGCNDFYRVLNSEINKQSISKK
ncbi:MAG TPA: alpha/beta hydrolase [Mobilitalea sp.]|nr:alpha/beta hydrolase [Mobilitalea sp.]